MPRFILTGAPGTGKTTVIDLLAHRFSTLAEPARELIAEHRAEACEASLDGRPELFVERLVARFIEDFEQASGDEVVFFDRGLSDCIAYASVYGLDPKPILDTAVCHLYEPTVFYSAPWEEIYKPDELRRATFAQIVEFDLHLCRAYDDLGYDLVSLPEGPPEARAAFILNKVGLAEDGA